jgi:hypothetical protein
VKQSTRNVALSGAPRRLRSKYLSTTTRGRFRGGRCAQSAALVHEVHVGAEPHIVAEIPTVVIGVIIDYDVVAVPQPIIAKGIVERGDGEEETTYRKSIVVTAVKPPDMARSPGTREMTVLPRMIKVIVRIIATSVMTYPPIAIGVHMGRGRMSGSIVADSALALTSPCAAYGTRHEMTPSSKSG